MKLQLTPRAVSNLRDIADYLQSRNPAAAERVADAIRGSLDLLLIVPSAGRPQRTEGVRKLVVRRYPYLVYYTVNELDEEVVVLSIRHSSQRRGFIDA